MQQVLATNVTAPLLITQALLANVIAAQGKIVMISSRMGSISDNDSGGRYGYRAAKAALNAASKSLALDLALTLCLLSFYIPRFKPIWGVSMLG